MLTLQGKQSGGRMKKALHQGLIKIVGNCSEELILAVQSVWSPVRRLRMVGAFGRSGCGGVGVGGWRLWSKAKHFLKKLPETALREWQN